MEKKKNNTLLIVGAGVAVGGALLLLSSGTKKEKIGSETFTPEPTNNPSPNQPYVPAAPSIDGNKLLKQGVTGPEVKKLQQLLGGLSDDGIFGPLTEAALVKKKGVKQITLNQYTASPDVNSNPAPAGSKLMALAGGAGLFEGIANADGTYRAGELLKTVAQGQHVGTLKAYNSTKTWYSVYYDGGLFSGQRVGFVKASQVKSY